MTKQNAAKAAAAEAARRADNDALAWKLRTYAADLEIEGRAHAPQWMREAADRLTQKDKSP